MGRQIQTVTLNECRIYECSIQYLMSGTSSISTCETIPNFLTRLASKPVQMAVIKAKNDQKVLILVKHTLPIWNLFKVDLQL